MSTTPVLHQQAIEPSQLTASRLDDIERIAHRLARVSWIPDVYKPVPAAMAKPWLPEKSVEQAEAEIAAAGMYLASIGRDLTPMTLKLVYVVNGAVDCMYDLISAQVHAHGHELWVEEESHESATVAGQRHGSSRVHRVTFTYEDAVRGGLTERWSKKDGKKVAVETYAKWTRDMLVARAGKRCAKRVAPEALLTMPPPMSYAYTDTGRVHLKPIVHEDQDDDIADAELVEPEQGEDPGMTPAQMSGGAGPSPVSRGEGVGSSRRPDTRPVSPDPTIEPEGGENVGTQVVGGSTAPLPRLATGPVDWREVRKQYNVTHADLLRKAQEFAKGRALPVPETLAEITDEQVEADLADWLGEWA